MNCANEIDRDAPLTKFERFCVGVIMLFVMACVFACIGCKTYYENAGLHVRTGSITAPIELSEPTSSFNCRFLFFLDGIDLYASKGSKIVMKYESIDAGTWLTSASTQKCEVVITPEKISEANAAANSN